MSRRVGAKAASGPATPARLLTPSEISMCPPATELSTPPSAGAITATPSLSSGWMARRSPSATTSRPMINVIDRDHMGKFQLNTDAVVQTIHTRGGGYGAMAYWNGHTYFAASDDYLSDYAIRNGKLALNNSSGKKFENPGATPSVSADGDKNAIVWVIATKTWNGPDNKPAVLYAYDAKDIPQPIYTSEQN